MSDNNVVLNKDDENIKAKWYVFRVQTGREDGLIKSLKTSFSILEKDGIDGNKYFIDFSVPKHNVIKYVSGKRVEKNVNAYPGYIFLKIKMTDNILLFLRRFFQMNGFGQLLPQTITDDEYNKMMDKVNGLSNNAENFVFRIGQRVKINAGSFSSMEGNITAIDEANKKLNVNIMIFNCETKVEVDFEQVSIIADDSN